MAIAAQTRSMIAHDPEPSGRDAVGSAGRRVSGWELALLATLLGCGVSACSSGGQGYDDGRDALTRRPVPDKKRATDAGGGLDAGVSLDAGAGSESEPDQPLLLPEQFEAATVPLSEVEMGTVQPAAATWRLLEVPTVGSGPGPVAGAGGWFALSTRAIGDGRAPSGYHSVLYHSKNGLEWESADLGLGEESYQLRGMAYGNGRLVLVGRQYPGPYVLRVAEVSDFSVEQSLSWTEIAQERDSSVAWQTVDFAGGSFYAFGSRDFGVSQDGLSWSSFVTESPQLSSVAVGNGTTVLAGNGPFMVSKDGQSWQSVSVSCELPGACIEDPSGGLHQGLKGPVLFAKGRFYANQLESDDGLTWTSAPGRSPAAFVSGHFLSGAWQTLQSWQPGANPEPLHAIRTVRASVEPQGRNLTGVGRLPPGAPPVSVKLEPYADGLDCTQASCVQVGSHLYLVPPAGAEPLADRVPRTAEGLPLLSRECPYSAQLFCEDYAQRTNCVCQEDAPGNPEHCPDVGQFGCEGRFQPEGEEWLDADSPGGCSCSFEDPNAPPSFGQGCGDVGEPIDGLACAAPLQCLAIDAPVGNGPPVPQRRICTAECQRDVDCPAWEATGYCAGAVSLRCSNGSCQPRDCSAAASSTPAGN